MYRKGFAPIIAIFIVAVVLIIGGTYWYLHKQPQKEITQDLTQAPTEQSASSTPANPVKISVNNISNPSTSTVASTTIEEDMPTSSISLDSQEQVGNYNLLVFCNEHHTIDHVDVTQNDTLIQTITRFGDDVPMPDGSCPHLEDPDINFDGNPDVMVLIDTGNSGNQAYQFLLFNTSTKQFYCPISKGNGCLLGDPDFDSTNKTISTHALLGCLSLCSESEVYKWQGDQLVLTKEVVTDTDDLEHLTTVTRELVNGQMATTSVVTSSLQGNF